VHIIDNKILIIRQAADDLRLRTQDQSNRIVGNSKIWPQLCELLLMSFVLHSEVRIYNSCPHISTGSVTEKVRQCDLLPLPISSVEFQTEALIEPFKSTNILGKLPKNRLPGDLDTRENARNQ